MHLIPTDVRCETSAQDFGSDFGRSRSRVEGRRTTEVGSRRK